MPQPFSPSSASHDALPLKIRRYLHFDESIRPGNALKLVNSPARVSKWEFLPVLRTLVVTEKVKRQPGGILLPSEKERPICYAAHHDAALYEYYARVLNTKYEALLKGSDLSECVTAFRGGLGKCNIHFASEAFTEIASRKSCVALAFDIKGFFDSLDHMILKDMWAKTLGEKKLPEDHYRVFRSVTKYSFVARDRIYARLGISKHNPRAHGRKRICSASDFRNIVRDEGFIQVHPDTFGIPQGLPISAVLSNIYLFNFDEEIAALCKTLNARYYRYCDDILVVAPTTAELKIRDAINCAIGKAKLEIQPAKTTIHQFVSGKITKGRPLQYLGFTFDGNKTLLRNAGITRYYARMRAAVRLAHNTRKSSDESQSGKSPIRTKKLFSKYTYLGKKTYISYALRSAALLGEDSIKHQMKPHWRKIRAEIKKKDDEYL